MAKYCGSCGAQLDDDAKVCGYCGTPFEGTYSKISGVKFDDSKKKERVKKVKKAVKRVVILAIVAIIAVVALRVAIAFTGYNKVVRQVMNAYVEYNIDEIVDLSSDIYYLEEEEFVESYFENIVGTTLDSLEDSVGHNHKLTYEVEEVYTVSDKKYRDTLNLLEETYFFYDTEYDMDLVEKIAIAEIKVTATQGEKKSSRSVDLTLIKESGEWKLLSIS